MRFKHTVPQHGQLSTGGIPLDEYSFEISPTVRPSTGSGMDGQSVLKLSLIPE